MIVLPICIVAYEDMRYKVNAQAYVHLPGLSQIEAALGANLPALQLVKRHRQDNSTRLRILCWVNTYERTHERAQAIKETWGKSCDKLLFMSNVEDTEIPTVRVVAPPTHEHLWQKHRFIVRLLAQEYDLNSYDWIFKCDDDTYLLMDNLQNYLQSIKEPKKPMLLGHRMTLQWWEMQKAFGDLAFMQSDRREAFYSVLEATRSQGGLYYTPGGSGYVFNPAYLTTLVNSLEKPFCLPDEVIPDDWAISFCMFHYGIIPSDTRDEFQRERFHQYSPEQVYYWPFDENDYDHYNYNSIYDAQNWFSDHVGIGWKNGSECCAPDSITFHYIRDMHLFHSYFELYA
ncbi:glycoprotein-N-acetylgalactosamine 3-beta-galactosyltransferase [Thraustotheca clavata]|uniref:N-acetylgalactosaminide beta-1,3-galactosyltransferase n=1 Tax=Thraustotheca clavata TaxID=74557 RepID=A0A1V9YSR9_9STRA|nr:glycoprotein-N-acetylgalactosamine 3-beta-galactosyltransferase [Thraustotheca clavata]